MSRLLTPEQINIAYDKAQGRWNEYGKGEVYEFNFLWQYIAGEVAKAQQELSDRETRRELGEWLESRMVAVPLGGIEYRVRLDEIESLKKGLAPK